MKAFLVNSMLPAALAAGLTLGASTDGPAQQFGRCYPPGQVQSQVERGNMLTLPEVLSRGGFGQDWTPVSVRVCDIGGQPHYVLGLRQGNTVNELVLNAISGARYNR